MSDMHLLNPPSSGEIFYMPNTSTCFYKLEVVKTILSESKETMLVEYNICLDPINYPKYKSTGKISLHAWNCWLRDKAMIKIDSPQEELSFMLKYS